MKEHFYINSNSKAIFILLVVGVLLFGNTNTLSINDDDSSL